MSAQETIALLIGCGKCDHRRPIFGVGKRISVKGGIRRSLVKAYRIPDNQWAKGDLDNMEHLMAFKGIPVFGRLNYVEQHEDGCYALGKLDALRKIDAFFKTDKTHFILYFTGHADEDGSWVFPVTKRAERSVTADSPARPSLPTGGGSAASTRAIEVSVDVHEPGKSGLESKNSVSSGTQPTSTPLTPPVSPNVDVMSAGGKTMNSSGQVPLSRFISTSYLSERPQPAKRWNELVTFEDIVQLWDNRKKKSKKNERFLMLILDSCHSGRWVEMVNELSSRVSDTTDDVRTESEVCDRVNKKSRHDICAQACCHPLENGMVAYNQLSSVFTRAFVSAQTRSYTEKLILSAIDHMFVLNLVSIWCYSKCRAGTPVSSLNGPFAGIKFFDSFDDMYLKT